MIFTMTATLRPDIIEQTISSFNKNLINVDMKKSVLYINIDPVPNNSDITNDQVVTVAEKFFGNVVVRSPDVPNFCSAIKWLWGQPSDEPYILHLEDDWELFVKLDCNVLVHLLTTQNLYEVRITKYLKKSATRKYGLSPALVSTAFSSVVSQNLDPTKNPERQLLQVANWGLTPHCPQTITAYPHGSIAIRDIGRAWRETLGIQKPADENYFVTWA